MAKVWTAVASEARHRFGARVGESTVTRRSKAPSSLRSAGAVQNLAAVAAGDDDDLEMNRGPVKDGDMDARGQPALPPEKVNLC
jgi:hypothetical protein